MIKFLDITYYSKKSLLNNSNIAIFNNKVILVIFIYNANENIIIV